MSISVRSVALAALALSGSLLMGGCGGGGSKGPPRVPETFSITGPSSAEAATALQFGSSVLGAEGLRFLWDFGDGSTSTEAKPTHSYAKGGDYDISLQISNAAGDRRTQQFKLSVTNLTNVRGLVCSGANDGGWCWQQPTPTGNELADVQFTSPSTGIGVGEHGDLFRTVNAGATWQRMSIGTEAHLSQIAFSNAQDGWIISGEGSLLRSSDGGASWTLSKLPFNNVCCSPMTVIDAKTALIPIDGNRVILTVDGGQTWTTGGGVPTAVSAKGVLWRLVGGGLTRSTDLDLHTTNVSAELGETWPDRYDQAFKLVGEQTLLISSAYRRYDVNFERTFYKQVLWRSDDAGNTWARIEPTGLEATELGLGALRLLRASPSDSLMLGAINDKLVRSEDGGQTWRRVSAANPYPLILGEALLLDNQTLLIPSREQIFRTDDVGLTWTAASAPSVNTGSSRQRALRQVSGDVVSLRTSGAAYLSTDRGRSWKPVLNTSAKRLGASAPLSFVDSRHGFTINIQGELSETRDGGKSWTLKLQLPRQGDIDNQLQFINDKKGWMLLGDGALNKTVDGGANWTAAQSPRPSLQRFAFADENRGWGLNLFSNTFLLTSDGGASWSETTSLKGAQGLYLGAGTQIVAYGSDGLLATSGDGGKSWTPRVSKTSAAIWKVAPQDGQTLWAVGSSGLVLRSADSGSSWVPMDLGTTTDLRDISFADARTGWIVGDRGLIYVTKDGGKSWNRQASGAAQGLTRVISVDSKTAWISGDRGGLLATGNGGF